MWPFERNETSKDMQSRPPCSHYRSTNTKIVSYSQLNEELEYTKTWRGQRYLTYRCLGCGRDFYIEEPLQNIGETFMSDNSIIDDEDELRAAEEELKRQVDEEDDRRFKPNM
jgi:hypothetical protein